MAKLAFKNQDKKIYMFNPFSSSGVSGANKESEEVIKTWNKLNEESITEASIGSINDINEQIIKLTDLMKKQKEKLKELISASSSLAGASCTGEKISCNVPSKLSSFSSKEIEVLKGEIEIIDSTIIFLGYLKTYLGFIKADNMYYKIIP